MSEKCFACSFLLFFEFALPCNFAKVIAVALNNLAFSHVFYSIVAALAFGM